MFNLKQSPPACDWTFPHLHIRCTHGVIQGISIVWPYTWLVSAFLHRSYRPKGNGEENFYPNELTGLEKYRKENSLPSAVCWCGSFLPLLPIPYFNSEISSPSLPRRFAAPKHLNYCCLCVWFPLRCLVFGCFSFAHFAGKVFFSSEKKARCWSLLVGSHLFFFPAVWLWRVL